MQEQLSAVCASMREKNIDWFVLAPGTNLEYLTGIKRRVVGYTRADHHGSWAEMAFLRASGELFYIAPRMIADFESDVQGSVTLKRIEEGEPVEAQLAQILRSIGVRAGGVAVEDRLWAHALLKLREILPQASFISGFGLIEDVRRIKNPYELELMREAAAITDSSFAEVVKGVEPGMSEWDIATELELVLKGKGAEALSFPTNVYSHSDAYPGDIRHRELRYFPLQRGTIIAFDFGCVYNGYCTDFGRTVSIGEPSKAIQAYQSAIVRAQQCGIEALRPGVTARDVHRVVCDAMNEASLGKYFVHRSGHGIGMDVHELPLLDELDDTPLEQGMVFAVEPSVIVNGELWVRIEDIAVVGKNAGLQLTHYPSELIIV